MVKIMFGLFKKSEPEAPSTTPKPGNKVVYRKERINVGKATIVITLTCGTVLEKQVLGWCDQEINRASYGVYTLSDRKYTSATDAAYYYMSDLKKVKTPLYNLEDKSILYYSPIVTAYISKVEDHYDERELPFLECLCGD